MPKDHAIGYCICILSFWSIFCLISLPSCRVSCLLSSKFIDVVLLLYVPGSSSPKDINISTSCSLLHFINTSWRHCYPEHFMSTTPFLFAYAEPEPVSLHSYASLFAMTSVLQHCLAAGTIKAEFLHTRVLAAFQNNLKFFLKWSLDISCEAFEDNGQLLKQISVNLVRNKVVHVVPTHL